MHSLDKFVLLAAPPVAPASPTEAVVLASMCGRGAAAPPSVDTPAGSSAAPAAVAAAPAGSGA